MLQEILFNQYLNDDSMELLSERVGAELLFFLIHKEFWPPPSPQFRICPIGRYHKGLEIHSYAFDGDSRSEEFQALFTRSGLFTVGYLLLTWLPPPVLSIEIEGVTQEGLRYCTMLKGGDKGLFQPPQIFAGDSVVERWNAFSVLHDIPSIESLILKMHK
jgi:hypothetical protein